MNPSCSAGPSGMTKGKSSKKRKGKKPASGSKQTNSYPERSMQEKEQLITAVTQQQCLWKKDLPNYHNRDDTRKAWTTVSDEVEIPSELVMVS